jgi:hypothetical protein
MSGETDDEDNASEVEGGSVPAVAAGPRQQQSRSYNSVRDVKDLRPTDQVTGDTRNILRS